MKSLFFIAFIFIAVTSLCAKGIDTDLSEAEKQSIQNMREEEKLAHDVYLDLYEKWKLPIFSNISNAETRHFNAIGYLIENFELNDPSLESVGKFQNQELQHLYDSLTYKGSQSLIAALQVGAFIEEVDIIDLQESLENTTNEIIQNTYENLLRASGNHLRAFTGQLAYRNKPYTPSVLDSGSYQKIIESSHRPGKDHGRKLRHCKSYK